MKDFISDMVIEELAEEISNEYNFSNNGDQLVQINDQTPNMVGLKRLTKCSSNLNINDLICEKITNPNNEWKKIEKSANPFTTQPIEITNIKVEDKNIIAVRKSHHNHFNYLAIEPEFEVRNIIGFIGTIRNHITWFEAPLLLILVLGIGYYFSSYVIWLIKDVQKLVSNTDAANLDVENNSKAHFKELETFIQVFESLKVRLKSSFDQTSRFSSNASHELKKPLTILRGHAEQGLKAATDGSREQLHFAIIAEQVDQLIGITDRLLLLAKADANTLDLNLTKINLSQLFEQIIESAQFARPDLSITQEIQENIYCDFDDFLLRQLLQNLFANSMKYASLNGRVHFQLKELSSSIRLEIQNTAINIPNDLDGKAFDRFYRGKEIGSQSIEGSGLGLSLCKEIAKAHKATVIINTDQPGVVKAILNINTKYLTT